MVFNLAIWRSGEKSPQFRPAALKYIRLRTIPVLQEMAVYSPENAMLVIPFSPGRNFMSLTRYTLGEAGRRQYMYRPYELSLSSKYKYTLERARMGRCADENNPVKAFSQLEITRYQDLINQAWLTS